MHRFCDFSGGYYFAGLVFCETDVRGFYLYGRICKSNMAAADTLVSCGRFGGHHRLCSYQAAGRQNKGEVISGGSAGDGGMGKNTGRTLSFVLYPAGMVYVEIVRELLQSVYLFQVLTEALHQI